MYAKNSDTTMSQEPPSSSSLSDRRQFFENAGLVAVASTLCSVPEPVYAASSAADPLIADLKASRAKMEPIPRLLSNGEWDAVRTILKTTPVNQLWNLGDSQNTLLKLAKITGDFELIELKDELGISLQICDQLTYDNAFVYFQPGNGKVKIKEPTDLAIKAMAQIDQAIALASGN